MTHPNKPVDGNDLWSVYEATAEAPWNLERVVHLHRRVGFGAGWGEIERDLREGPGPSVDRLLAGKAPISSQPADFEVVSELLADAAVASRDANRLKAWWVYRMLFSPDPLGEKLTLLWHNHFATSNAKVDDPAAMRVQNDTFRKLARAPFGELLRAMLKDPALLAWLDAPANRKGHPNENLGRELMELFTLGVGHYTEADVKESARTLTGLSVKDEQYQFLENVHDTEEKTILGRKGNWAPEDLAKLLVEQPATARRIADRLCGLTLGENVASAPAVAQLAEGLTKNDLSIAWGVATIVRSRLFFAKENIGSRVADPEFYVVSPLRALGLAEPPPSTLVLADWIARIGRDLFHPPNVGGWNGGRRWLNSRSLIARTNYASALVQGRPIGRPGMLDTIALAALVGEPRDRNGALAAASKLLLGKPPDPHWTETLPKHSAEEPEAARRNIALLLASPPCQLN